VKWALKGMTRVMVGFKRKPGVPNSSSKNSTVNWARPGDLKLKEKRCQGEKYTLSYEPVPLEKIPSCERGLPAGFFDKKKGMVTPAFVKYALPLIGKDLPCFTSL
jgi:hypothetical protein